MIVRRRYTCVALGLMASIACVSEAPTPTPQLPPLVEVRADRALTFGDPHDECQECHPQHVAEWEISPHAYSMRDPVFHAMVRLGQKQSQGKLGQFCVQCHSPVALAAGSTPVYQDPESGAFRQDTEMVSPLEKKGVSCDVCHSMTEVIEPLNARAVLTPDGVRRSSISNPKANTAHASEYSSLHKDGLMCGMCHAVTNPKNARIEETFTEWKESSFGRPGGRTCQDCHMPAVVGPAAKDGPDRLIHRHTFVGVDVSLLPPEEFPGYDEMRMLAARLLRQSCDVRLAMDTTTKRLGIELENLTGHSLPSGATAERQMWVELVVQDAYGRVVFETGTLDENGDLRDAEVGHSTRPGSDPQLIHYYQQMLDDPRITVATSTQPVKKVAFPWQANAADNHVIAADSTDRRSLDLSTLPPGKYSARFRLLFRTFPPYFLRELERLVQLDPAVKDRVPTVNIHEEALTFEL